MTLDEQYVEHDLGKTIITTQNLIDYTISTVILNCMAVNEVL